MRLNLLLLGLALFNVSCNNTLTLDKGGEVDSSKAKIAIGEHVKSSADLFDLKSQELAIVQNVLSVMGGGKEEENDDQKANFGGNQKNTTQKDSTLGGSLAKQLVEKLKFKSKDGGLFVFGLNMDCSGDATCLLVRNYLNIAIDDTLETVIVSWRGQRVTEFSGKGGKFTGNLNISQETYNELLAPILGQAYSLTSSLSAQISVDEKISVSVTAPGVIQFQMYDMRYLVKNLSLELKLDESEDGSLKVSFDSQSKFEEDRQDWDNNKNQPLIVGTDKFVVKNNFLANLDIKAGMPQKLLVDPTSFSTEFETGKGTFPQLAISLPKLELSLESDSILVKKLSGDPAELTMFKNEYAYETGIVIEVEMPANFSLPMSVMDDDFIAVAFQQGVGIEMSMDGGAPVTLTSMESFEIATAKPLAEACSSSGGFDILDANGNLIHLNQPYSLNFSSSISLAPKPGCDGNSHLLYGFYWDGNFSGSWSYSSSTNVPLFASHVSNELSYSNPKLVACISSGSGWASRYESTTPYSGPDAICKVLDINIVE